LDHTYAPEVQRRLSGQLKPKGCTWHIDETFVKIAGRWMYLFRAVDSRGQTLDFYLSQTRDRQQNAFCNKLWRIQTIQRHTFLLATLYEAIPPRFGALQREGRRRHLADIGPAVTRIIASNPITGISNDDCVHAGPAN
jgi:hypothetical protein